MANTTNDSLVLTWWLARRFIYGEALTSTTNEWKADRAEANRILSNNLHDARSTILQEFLTLDD